MSLFAYLCCPWCCVVMVIYCINVLLIAPGMAPSHMSLVLTLPAGPQAMEAALLSEKARSAELELHLRALAAELLRSQQASMSIGRAVLPVLSGIEYRLTDMFSKAQVQQAQLQAAPQTYQVTA